MRLKQLVRIVIDTLMTVMLLLLMAYSIVGEAIHEWIGICMFVLFILHHIVNRKWNRNLFSGKYTLFRIVQTIFVISALVTMLGSMVSGVVLSRHVLAFLPITGGQSWARTLHMLSAYWGFTFISLHLGLHWNIMIGMAQKMFHKPSAIRTWIVRMVGLTIAGYGAYAFMRRQIASYMFLRIQFVFFDYEEPLLLFLLDYIAVMGLFVFLGYCVCRCCIRRPK